MVRSDENIDSSYRKNTAWEFSNDTKGNVTGANNIYATPGGDKPIASFSGNERNHLFINQEGQQFDDQSALSGIDNPADGRAFALWDYDHDGWQDIALVNANAPQLNLYRNEMANQAGHNRSIAIRLTGGNTFSKPSTEWSARDAYGAEVTAICGDKNYVRELRCSEGFAAQNSRTLIIGIGEADKVDQLIVKWPSGKSHSLTNVKAGALVNAFENPADNTNSPDTNFFLESYSPAQLPAKTKEPETFMLDGMTSSADKKPKLYAYVATATWCEACKKSLPQFSWLKENLGDDVSFYGIPADPDETTESLKTYQVSNQTPFDILTSISDNQRDEFLSLQTEEALPSVLVTDSNGNILKTTAGAPNLSWFKQLLKTNLAEEN